MYAFTLWARSFLGALAVVASLLIATPASANAGTLQSTTATQTATVTLAQAQLPQSWSDCRRVAKGARSPFHLVKAALSVRGCVVTAGNGSADAICWASRQWWGGGARWVVWMITGGRYDKC